jgi:hypothetical protein
MSKVLIEHDYELATELAAKGNSLRTIAREMGIRWGTFLKQRKVDEQLEEAIQTGRGQEHDALFGRLYEIATQSKGKEAVTACIFLLKCRHRYREQGDLQEAASRVSVQITLPGALTPEQYENLTPLTAPAPIGSGTADLEHDSGGMETDGQPRGR